MKCNQSRPGFEFVSPCPFPTTISITPRTPPKRELRVITIAGDAMLPLFSLHGLKLNRGAYIKCLEKLVLSVSGEWLWEDSAPYHTSSRNEGIIATISSQTSYRQTPRLKYFWILCVERGWVRDQKKNFVQYERLTEGKDNGNIYQFKMGNRRKVLQLIRKTSGDWSWRQWLFSLMNLIYSISRYFHAILVNISDRAKYIC